MVTKFSHHVRGLRVASFVPVMPPFCVSVSLYVTDGCVYDGVPGHWVTHFISFFSEGNQIDHREAKGGFEGVSRAKGTLNVNLTYM